MQSIGSMKKVSAEAAAHPPCPHGQWQGSNELTPEQLNIKSSQRIDHLNKKLTEAAAETPAACPIPLDKVYMNSHKR